MTTSAITRAELARLIADRLKASEESLRAQWNSARPFAHAAVDDLLPADIALRLHNSLPDASMLLVRQSDKERKRVGVALEKYDPLIGDILFAFQDEEVVRIFRRICGHADLEPDPSLYGSGISEMLEGDFLLPHLDNSHDGDGQRYRVLNALYYITPDWPADGGGSLELWDKAMRERTEVHARFNRLVLMETHRESIHSVSKVAVRDGRRSCISNYYFSASPGGGSRQYVHRTTFYARPEGSLWARTKLRLEGTIKNALGRLIGNGRTRVKHRRQ